MNEDMVQSLGQFLAALRIPSQVKSTHTKPRQKESMQILVLHSHRMSGLGEVSMPF